MLRSKLLFLIPTLDRAGAESLLVNCSLELKSVADWEFEVCTLKPGYPYEARLLDAGIPLHTLNFRHHYDLARIDALARLLHKRRYDIIHSHLFPANLLAAMTCREARVKLVMTEHSAWNRRRRLSLFRIVDRFVYSKFDAIVCVSRAVESSLLDWIPQVKGKTYTILNGISVFPLDEIREKTIDILCVGNLNRHAKGVDVLLEAVNLIADSVNSVCVAGQGYLTGKLKRQRDQLGLHSKIHFLGLISDVRSLMLQSKVFILPSRWEGLPLALLEAMEASMPIIATRVGGIPEVIRDHVNGILVPPENPKALAEGILLLLQNESLGKEYGWNARQAVMEQYSITVHAHRLLRLYDELLKY